MAKRDKMVKWVNKFSREEGYVKSVYPTKGHFINTFDATLARKYFESEARHAIDVLTNIGEAENNEFYIV